MTLRLVILISFSLIVAGTTIFGQPDTRKKEEIYQNQQRALKLTLLQSDTKSLADAPMRCFARTQVVKFIFGAKVTDYFDTANSSAVDCLDDIQNNSSQFSSTQASYWKKTLITLLRQNSPDLASKAAKKYLNAEDLSLSDLQELESGDDPAAVTNRISAEIAKGNIPPDIFSIFLKLRQTKPELSYRILDVFLGYLESNSNLGGVENKLDFFSTYYIDDSVPTAIGLRYLRFSVNLAQSQLAQGETTGLYEASYNLLGSSLPKIKELIPTLYEQALGVYLAMSSKISSANKERDEAYKRIDESKDKLQQAIFEAEAAEKKPFEDTLWLYASQLAAKQKKFQIAADCILKFQAEVKASVSVRDNMLLNTVLPDILKEKDFESAEYVLKRIEDDRSHSSGFLKVASTYLDLGNKSQAFESLEDALKFLRKTEPSADVVRISLSSVQIAMRIEKAKAFETASSAIKMVNHLPTPNIDDKTGSPSRMKYTDNILLPTAFNLASAFKILAKSDVDFAASTAEEIQSKNWKLAAEIVVETERLYPLPKEPKKPVANPNRDGRD